MLTDTPPPEGVLIETARMRLGISPPEAASRVLPKPISDNRWRAIVLGNRRGDGSRTGLPRAETWAKLAVAVELAPEAFETLDPPREDIALLIRAFTSPPARSIIADRHAPLLTMLTTLDEMFGQEVFDAAVSRVVALRRQGGRLKTQHRSNRKVDA